MVLLHPHNSTEAFIDIYILPSWTLRTRDIKQFAQGQWILDLGFK